MTLSVPRVRHYLKHGDLEKLFIEELGWDRYTGKLDVQVDGQTYTLQGCAEKRGVQILQCQPDRNGKFPGYNLRRKIEQQVTKSATVCNNTQLEKPSIQNKATGSSMMRLRRCYLKM